MRVQELKVEVEQRGLDTAKLQTEKALLQDEVATVGKKLEAMEAAHKTYLHTVTTAFEAERLALENEVKKRAHKAKAVDVERQELLKETHELGTQLAAAHAEGEKMKGEAATATARAQAAEEALIGLRAQLAAANEETQEKAAAAAKWQATAEVRLSYSFHPSPSAVVGLTLPVCFFSRCSVVRRRCEKPPRRRILCWRVCKGTRGGTN